MSVILTRVIWTGLPAAMTRSAVAVISPARTTPIIKSSMKPYAPLQECLGAPVLAGGQHLKQAALIGGHEVSSKEKAPPEAGPKAGLVRRTQAVWQPTPAHSGTPAPQSPSAAPLRPGEARPRLPLRPIGPRVGADDAAAGARHAWAEGGNWEPAIIATPAR